MPGMIDYLFDPKLQPKKDAKLPGFDQGKWEDFVIRAFEYNNRPKTIIFSCEKGLRKFIRVLNQIRPKNSKPIRMRDIEKNITRHKDGTITLRI